MKGADGVPAVNAGDQGGHTELTSSKRPQHFGDTEPQLGIEGKTDTQEESWSQPRRRRAESSAVRGTGMGLGPQGRGVRRATEGNEAEGCGPVLSRHPALQSGPAAQGKDSGSDYECSERPLQSKQDSGILAVKRATARYSVDKPGEHAE